MNKRLRGALVGLGAGWLSGCAVGPVNHFTLEVDLPAEFRFTGAANYGPARGPVVHLAATSRQEARAEDLYCRLQTSGRTSEL